MRLLARTLAYNGLVAVVATGMAWPVAVVLGRGRGVILGAMMLALPVALLLPSLTYAYAWAQALRLAGVDPMPQSWGDVARCVWTLAAWLWPIPAAVVGWSLRRMDDQVQQQALLDGVLWRVTVRQLVGPLVAAMAIVGVLSCQEFSVWERTGISVVSTETRMVFETGSPSSPSNRITSPMTGADLEALPRSTQSERAAEAVATTLPLLLVVGGLSVVAYGLLRERAAGSEVAGGQWPGVLDAGGVMKGLSVVMLMVTLAVPVGALVLSMRRTFSPVTMFVTFAPQLVGSLVIAACVGVLAFGVALAAAHGRSRWVLPVTLLAFLVGGQLIAIALIRTYNRPWLSFVYNEAPIVVLAHLARFAWVPVAAGLVTFAPAWRALREVAAVDGATRWQAARYVVWPLAWPVLVAGGALTLILSLGEAPATVLLVPQRPPMMVPLLTTWVHLLRSDDMIEATLVTMFTVMALTLIAAAGYALARKKIGTGGIFVLLLATMLTAAGCGDSTQPDDVWLETGTGPGQVVYPRAIAYSAHDDTFFVVDRVARVQHLDRSGRCLAEWRMPEWDNGKPVGLTVGPDGNLYVPDTHYARIIVYTPEGKEVRRWGSHGTGKGQFIFPTDVAFDDKGRIFVSEYGDHDRIQVFNQQGVYLYEIGSFGDGPGQLSRPDEMVIDGETLYVADNGNHRIAVFKTDGTFVRNMGTVGSGPGEFRFPRGLADDHDGHLVVCEFGNNRVQRIDKETGRSLGTWGAGGHEPGQLAYPWGVTVDKRGRVVAVDAGNNRLQVFRF
jgi:ABC-type Fe3+ transport system permease subunit/sugar lactone lactonase YvrE